MPKGYWIAHVDVTNADEYPAYLQAAQPAYEKYGARFLVRGGEHQAPETAQRSRHVVVEFADYETALACYNSPEYQAAAAIRQANSNSDVIIVAGHDG